MRTRTLLFAALSAAVVSTSVADWHRTETTLAWKSEDDVVWQLSFDSAKGKPFFHPVSVNGGTSLTNFRPEDHPWHYGLWFSWKFINGANYWEENRQTGRSEGTTRWGTPKIDTKADGRAIIAFTVTYTHPSGRVDLTEARELHVSAPATDGSYFIDWSSRFVAGTEGAVLDRTPMPNEPEGKFNGGYAGLSARLASAPAVVSFVTSDGPVTEFTTNRARPSVGAVAANVTENGKDVGALAILSAPANTGAERAPWYLVNADMRFACAAILAPRIITLPAGGELKLKYRLAVQPAAWTPESLKSALAKWTAAGAK
ncbi:MAG TPA: DUF6807 family protein [Opitutus sp.]|nr:DUF6807 family protein [Opitutus sp.]